MGSDPRQWSLGQGVESGARTLTPVGRAWGFRVRCVRLLLQQHQPRLVSPKLLEWGGGWVLTPVGEAGGKGSGVGGFRRCGIKSTHYIDSVSTAALISCQCMRAGVTVSIWRPTFLH